MLMLILLHSCAAIFLLYATWTGFRLLRALRDPSKLKYGSLDVVFCLLSNTVCWTHFFLFPDARGPERFMIFGSSSAMSMHLPYMILTGTRDSDHLVNAWRKCFGMKPKG